MKNIIVSGITAIVVAVLVLVVGLNFVGNSTPPAAPSDSVGAIVGPVHNTPENFTQGIGMGSKYLQFAKSFSIAAGSNVGTWQNKTGRTAYIDLANGTLVASSTGSVLASTTQELYAYASSTLPGTLYDFAAPASAISGGSSFNKGFVIATSSTATTTSSLDLAFAGEVIAVPDQWYVIFFLKQTYNQKCTGSICETATSTNRGFNIDAYIQGYFAP